MTSPAVSYRGYRFSPEIISHAVWLYHQFCVSLRDSEDLLAQRGITVSYPPNRTAVGDPQHASVREQSRRGLALADTSFVRLTTVC